MVDFSDEPIRLILKIAAEVGINELKIAEVELLPMESQSSDDSWLRRIGNWCRGLWT